MAATMKDIASRTGLGLATISKYLNGGTVREKNRIAIEEAIKELDFTVNEFARSLKTHQSKTIGIVIPELSNVFITSIISVMEDVLRKKGYGILVCDSRTDEVLERQAVQFLLNKMVDGIVMMPVSRNSHALEPALQKKIPIVLIDRMIDGTEHFVDAVLVDNHRAAYESTSYLIEQGHRKIGILVGPKDVSTSLQRLQGYREALQENGLPVLESLIYYSDYTLQGGYQAAKVFFEQENQATALFVTNYEMTLGTILRVNELGLSIPEQISLIGFDNLELARIVNPALTIVEQPIHNLGVQAAEMLLSRFSGGQREKTVRLVLPTTLKFGRSVKKIIKQG